MDEKNYLSIGEVLGLLLDEFPDVTISKIRFLESQGLIEPERTPSGYRKFSRQEIDRLRFILREQRENYLPLKVIRNRLDREIVEVGAKFVELGIDVRHLKAWKHSAEREMALFEQRIIPFLRQRNPAAREQAMELLNDLIELGEQLRASLIAAAAKPYEEGR
jgi:DNA-binding transcriptional MerR regulator